MMSDETVQNIIIDHDNVILKECVQLKHQAHLLERITDDSIDWSHHLGWDVRTGDKKAGRKKIIADMRKQLKRIENELDKFETIIDKFDA